MLLVIATAAVFLDLLLGEPRRGHPLVLFGNWVQRVEARLHRDRRSAGVLVWCVSVLPLTCVAAVLQWGLWCVSPRAAAGFAAITLYLALGLRSLGEHPQAVIDALRATDLPAARAAVGRIVSRDTAARDATQVAAAATESVLENGSDAVFAALFWGVALGAPGAVLYRLSNTLDAMWGYRTPRYVNFGWASARIDDALNWLPARLTAATYAVLGRTRAGMRCAWRQGRGWKSPNAGPVMAAGAGVLHVQLGGPAP
ncbi:adenosylcobinamide-phosphate synthase CbiB, partial [Xanthomonas axonopodis]